MYLPPTIDDLKQIASAMPEPKADALHINSEREKAALSEHMDTRPAKTAAQLLGLPVYCTVGTPPGVLRVTLRGEVVEDIPIR